LRISFTVPEQGRRWGAFYRNYVPGGKTGWKNFLPSDSVMVCVEPLEIDREDSKWKTSRDH